MMSSDDYFLNPGRNGSGGKPGYSGNRSGGRREQDPEKIVLKKLFYTLWHNRLIILGSIVLFTSLAAVIAYTETPIYRSDGTILISEQSGSSPAGGDLANLLSSSYGVGIGSTIANELQIMRSRKLSLEMADSLLQRKAVEDEISFPILYTVYPDDPAVITDRTVIANRIRGNINFSRVDRETDLVQVSYKSPSPEEAAFIVNLAIELYSGLSNRQNHIAANSAVEFLEIERERIENRLNAVEERLRNFMNREKLVQIDSQTERLIGHMAELESRRQEVGVMLVAVNSSINHYRQRLEEIKPGLAEQYAEAIGPNMTRLQYQLAELELQKMQLLANNPGIGNRAIPPVELQEVNAEIKLYRDRIRSLTEDLMEQGDQYLGFLGGADGNVAQIVTDINQRLIELQVEQQQYEAQMEMIDGKLAGQRTIFENLPDNMIEMARLQRDVNINEELYVTVSQQFAEMSLWRETQFGLGRPVDSAYVPGSPVAPDRERYLLLGFTLGCIIGMGYIFVREAFNTRIDSIEKLKEFDYPLLSVIPSMTHYLEKEQEGREKVSFKERRISSTLVTLLNVISPISESFRRLESNIIYSNPDQDLKSIMVTSATQSEGKTTIVSNLGVVLAEMGFRVVLVDADLRRPNLHRQFGLPRRPGIFEVLFEDVPLAEAVQPTVVNGLSVLPAGQESPNPSAVTQSRAFLDIIDKLEKEEELNFDYVLIDTAPYGIITDASALVNHTGGVVVVSRFNHTKEAELTHLLNNLRRVDANILGNVLTDFNFNLTGDYYSSQYYSSIFQDYERYHIEE